MGNYNHKVKHILSTPVGSQDVMLQMMDFIKWDPSCTQLYTDQ